MVDRRVKYEVNDDPYRRVKYEVNDDPYRRVKYEVNDDPYRRVKYEVNDEPQEEKKRDPVVANFNKNTQIVTEDLEFINFV